MKDLGLKWHVLGKLTISYILVFACAIIPVTASKYVSQAEGSSSARVARFEAPYITYDEFTPGGDIVATEEPKYYVFEAHFTVNVNQEVSSLYTLDIYLDPNDTTAITALICPDITQTNSSGKTYSFSALDGTDASAAGITLSYFTGDTSEDFEAGKIYYSRYENGEKKWYSATPISNGAKQVVTVTPEGGVAVGTAAETHAYSVLFFVKADASGKADGEQMEEEIYIKYDIDCWQVD